MSDNAAMSGGALFIDSGATDILTNTILAYSPSGGNCNAATVTARYSISSDNFCVLSGTGNVPHLDQLLTGLGNYGGPTPVHMLKAGSLAIDGVPGLDAPADDQRGFARPQGGGFDIGAVERQPTDSNLAPRLYLSVIRR